MDRKLLFIIIYEYIQFKKNVNYIIQIQLYFSDKNSNNNDGRDDDIKDNKK